MSFYKSDDTSDNQPADSSYIHDELFILIKEIQFHYSLRKGKAIKAEEAVQFNRSIILFFQNIVISNSSHLNYIAQKLRLTHLSCKDSYMREMLEDFKHDEDKISPSTIDFRLRAVLYIYRFYHLMLTPEVKKEMIEGIVPLFKYIKNHEEDPS